MKIAIPSDKIAKIIPFHVPFTITRKVSDCNLTEIDVRKEDECKMEVVYKFLGIITPQKQTA